MFGFIICGDKYIIQSLVNNFSKNIFEMALDKLNNR